MALRTKTVPMATPAAATPAAHFAIVAMPVRICCPKFDSLPRARFSPFSKAALSTESATRIAPTGSAIALPPRLCLSFHQVLIKLFHLVFRQAAVALAGAPVSVQPPPLLHRHGPELGWLDAPMTNRKTVR